LKLAAFRLRGIAYIGKQVVCGFVWARSAHAVGIAVIHGEIGVVEHRAGPGRCRVQVAQVVGNPAAA